MCVDLIARASSRCTVTDIPTFAAATRAGSGTGRGLCKATAEGFQCRSTPQCAQRREEGPRARRVECGTCGSLEFCSTSPHHVSCAQTRLQAEVRHLETALDAAKAEALDLKRQRDRSERELQRIAASDVAPPSPTKSSTLQGLSTRELPLRPMQENRPVHSTPASPAAQNIGVKTETPYGTGYGGVHASRST